jgi:hypothetical protein
MKNLQANMTVILPLVTLLTTLGCGTNNSSSTADSSVSGTVASSIGGAFNSNGGSLTYNDRIGTRIETLFANLFLPLAYATNACPTLGGSAAGCSSSGNSPTTVTLNYNNCEFGNSKAVWNGSQILSANGIACTGFPALVTVTRTFVVPTTRKSPAGDFVSIDTSNDATAADGTKYSGGSSITTGPSGSITQIVINGINYIQTKADNSSGFNHTVTTAASGGSTITLSEQNITTGGIVTFHNKAKVKAVSTFNNVTFSAGCCHPTSGSISTTFSTINGVTPAQSGFVGTTETLTFTGCGTATYSGPESYHGSVSLNHCL